jgi:acetyl-CoA acyltransferase
LPNLGANAISKGAVDVVICGGTETMSDLPIRLNRSMRKLLISSRKIKSPMGYLKLLLKLRPKHFIPEVPAVSEFSTQETMGFSADRLASAFDVSRKDQVRYLFFEIVSLMYN